MSMNKRGFKTKMTLFYTQSDLTYSSDMSRIPLSYSESRTSWKVLKTCVDSPRLVPDYPVLLDCYLLEIIRNAWPWECACALSDFSCVRRCDPMDCSPPCSSVHGDSPGKNTGVGCHLLLQGIFPTQGSNPHLLCLLLWQAGSWPGEAPPGKPLGEISDSCESD